MGINAKIKDEVERDLAKFNATLFRHPDSMLLAQRWYYPEGVKRPELFAPLPEGVSKVRVFFANEADQKAFVAMYPAISDFCTESGTLQMLDQITAHYAEDYADYKQTYWSDFHEADRPK